ncbi:MAG: ABC transporter ATP-binding protein [Abitibacteriaceae bacterium]|nr:ABC transporter ATP-binding protein [Abditibacteriaceae bacterium]
MAQTVSQASPGPQIKVPSTAHKPTQSSPDKDFEKDLTAPDTGLQNLWRFMAFIGPYRIWVIGACITGLIRMVLPLYMPAFVKNVIDRVLNAHGLNYAQRMHLLWGMMPLLALILTIHAGATLGRIYWAQVAGTNAVRDIRYLLFDHVQRLSLEFHNQRPTGGIVARLMNDVTTAQNAFDLLFIQGSQNVMQAVVITGYLVWRDWQWALVSFATLPIFIITTRLLRQHVRTASRQVLETNSRISGHLQERISMVREVQSFTREDYESRRVQRQVRVLKGYTLRQFFLNAILLASSEITRTLGLVVMLVFGVHRVLHGNATVGDVTAFYLYVGMLLAPVDFLSNLYTNLHSTAIAADRVFEFFDTTPQVQDVPNARVLEVNRPPAVHFEQVIFAYPDDPATLVLKGIDFEVQPGWRVVLVGGSGSGKSSLMNLLLRFYNLQSGRILIGGQDISQVTTHSLRQVIGIVPQQPLLFRGTVRDNILYGRQGASDEEVHAAAIAANAEQFILNLPDGYDTVIGERGVGLSGGQVQRIAIARAFLKDPAVLIMDEATSNLDAQSEALVLDALNRLANGRTTFIIAHRLGVATTADLVLVMQHGNIIERGNHDELIENGPIYRHLWAQQVAGILTNNALKSVTNSLSEDHE